MTAKITVVPEPEENEDITPTKKHNKFVKLLATNPMAISAAGIVVLAVSVIVIASRKPQDEMTEEV
jgi:hypothetical protein